jgi:hypothetical protein
MRLSWVCALIFGTGTPKSPKLERTHDSNLVKIRAAQTENDDHNPPRIQPRSLFDMAMGIDNVNRGDKYKVSLR